MAQAIKTLSDQVRQGDRRALAKAITLVESTRDDHRQQTVELLETLIPDVGNSIRIGISGAPGATAPLTSSIYQSQNSSQKKWYIPSAVSWSDATAFAYLYSSMTVGCPGEFRLLGLSRLARIKLSSA